MNTYTYIVYRDNQEIKRFENQESDIKLFPWLLRNQSQSIHWALKYGGYKVDVINEQTKEITKY